MKTKNNLILSAGKLVLVFCTLFSQLSFSLEVFAEEVTNTYEDVVSNEIKENNSNDVLDESNNDNTVTENNDLNYDEEVTTLENTDNEETVEEQEQETNNSQNETLFQSIILENDSQLDNTDNTEVSSDETLDDEIDSSDDVQSDQTNQIEENGNDDLVDVSLTIDDENKLIIINDVLEQQIKVSQLKELIESSIENISVEDIEAKVSDEVLDEESVVNDENIKNVVVTINEIDYRLSVLYDYNNDGVVNLEDVELYDYNDDGVVDYKDLDFLCTFGESGQEKYNDDETYKKLSYLNKLLQSQRAVEPKEAIDNLNVAYSIDSYSVVGNSVLLTIKLNGFEKNAIDVIAGKVNFDPSLLKLVEFNVVDAEGNDNNNLSIYNDSGYFIICLSNSYNSDSNFLTLKFEALSDGFAKVNFDYLSFFDSGVKLNATYDSDLEVSISPSDGKGGDDDSDLQIPASSSSEDEPIDNKVVGVIEKAKAPVVVNVNKSATYVALSSNNYISVLDIKGYDIDFNKYTYEYSIDVDSDVNSLDLSVILDGANATYEVFGNENFKTGSNKVEIVVTAEDGSTRTYTINVNKKKADSSKADTKNDAKTNKGGASKTIIIVLIILVIIGLIYVIFKDDDEDIVISKNDSTKKNGNKK